MTYVPAESAEGAAWLTEQLADVPEIIGRVVPAGYAAYARVFPRGMTDSGPRRWSDADTRPLAPRTTFPKPFVDTSGSPLEFSVDEGSLDSWTSLAITSSLSQRTTSRMVTIALWEGYADSAPFASAPSVTLPPARRFLLLRSPAAASSETLDGATNGRRPTRWWPDDRSWIVGADIYSRSVMVAGSAAAIVGLLGVPEIDAVRVTPVDRVTTLE